MRLLAFESSAKTASVALLEDGNLLAEYMQDSGQTHSRTLLKMAEDMLSNCEWKVSDLDYTAVSAGPGSFTGLRIGLAAAKGLSWGAEIPCVGVSTLEAMAHFASSMDGVLVCCMDARREQVYNALFSCENGCLTRLTEDRAISIEELAQELENIEKPKILVGDGASLCYNTLKERIQLRLAPQHLRQQRASGTALAAWEKIQRGEITSVETLVPNYLRLSQAERERAEKLKQKGEV